MRVWFWAVVCAALAACGGDDPQGSGDDANSANNSADAGNNGEGGANNADGADTDNNSNNANNADDPGEAQEVVVGPGTPTLGDLGGPPVGGRFPAEVPEGFVWRDLGIVEAAQGESADLSLEVEAGAQALWLYVLGPVDGHVLPLRVLDPAGAEVVRPEVEGEPDLTLDGYFGGFAGPATSPNRTLPRPVAGAWMLPNTPQIALAPGVWTVRLGLYHVQEGSFGEPVKMPLSAALRVGVLERRAPAPLQGQVHLSLYFSGSDGLTAASAAQEPTLQRALEQIEALFGEVGLELGQVEFLDMDAGAQGQKVQLDGPGCLGGADVQALFEKPSEPRPNAIKLFFVERFECLRLEGQFDAGAQLAGISNGVPGMPLASRDGVMVATHLMRDYPEPWSKVMAHELGHFLGLFHTREGRLDVYDNIADTDEGEGASEYLMYSLVDQGGEAISADQAWVLRQTPFLAVEP
jgi:hypothetical protein